jgi:hypothetical protein
MNNPMQRVADIWRSNALLWLILLTLSTTTWGQTFIGNVNANALDTSAVVTWTTAVPASSQVKYGTSQAYGKADTLDSTLVMQHSATISGLTASTTYHFSVISADSSGEQVASLDSKFTTASSSTGTIPTPTGGGIWTSAAELANLPMSGTAWTNLKNEADGSCGTADVADQQSFHDTCTLAQALVFARTGIESYRTAARTNIGLAIGTEVGGRELAWGRNLDSYVIAADLINLPSYDPTFDQNVFRPWIKKVVFTELDINGITMVDCNEKKPQNWGVVCGASRAATDIYLGNTTDLARVAQVFRGYLGDTSAYNGYSWSTTNLNGGLTFVPAGQPEMPVNSPGGTVGGHNVDGALIAEMSRCGSFSWPPCYTNYVWTGAGGMIVEADILYRAGYDVYNWSNKAVLRIYSYFKYLDDTFPTAGWWNQGSTGPNNWQPWIVNKRYGTSFPHQSPVNQGWNMSWTDWTHQ